MSRAQMIRHPGPRSATRRFVVPGHARRVAIPLPRGAVLAAAVAAAMDALGCDTAVLVLDGLAVGPYHYVMPATESPDGKRAAWYSRTYSGDSAILEHATTTVGRRDGEWFVHCHAVWDRETGRTKSGHLLPDSVTVAEDATITGFVFDGGLFEFADDAETGFAVFRPRPMSLAGPAGHPVNAAIVSLAPFEDVGEAVSQISGELGLEDAQLFGLGSLIGADFESGPSMESPISEVFLLPGARPGHLPMHCVDPDGAVFRGVVRPGTAPVLVTFEMILVAADL